MVKLNNGIEVIISSGFNDLWVSISNFGCESDHTCVVGISHLMEHVLINTKSINYIYNGITSREGMVFYCRDKKGNGKGFNELLSWFFHEDGSLKIDVIKSNLENYFSEIENENYFRCLNFKMEDPLSILQGMEAVMCGRYEDYKSKEDLIKKEIPKRLLNLHAGQIKIFMSSITQDQLNILNKTFGSLNRFPMVGYQYPSLTIPPKTDLDNNLVVVTGSPFNQILFSLDNDSELIETVGNLSLVTYDIELSFIAGNSYAVFYFSNQEDIPYFLIKLNKNLLTLNIKNQISSDLKERIALNYAKNPLVVSDMITKPYYEKIELESLKSKMKESLDSYGKTLVLVNNNGFNTNQLDPKGSHFGAYPYTLDLEKNYPNLIIEIYKNKSTNKSTKKSINSHTENYNQNDNFHQRRILNIIKEVKKKSDYSSNGICYNNIDEDILELSDNKENLKIKEDFDKLYQDKSLMKVCDYQKNVLENVSKNNSGMFENYSPEFSGSVIQILNDFNAVQAAQWAACTRSNPKIRLNTMSVGEIDYKEDYSNLKVAFFKHLLNIYFKAIFEFDISKALLYFPIRHYPIKANTVLKSYNYNYCANDATYVVKSPYSFIASHLVVLSPTFDRHEMINCLCKVDHLMKQRGNWYEHNFSNDANSFYSFSHTTTPLKAEQSYRILMNSLIDKKIDYKIEIIVSQKANTFDFKNCPIRCPNNSLKKD